MSTKRKHEPDSDLFELLFSLNHAESSSVTPDIKEFLLRGKQVFEASHSQTENSHRAAGSFGFNEAIQYFRLNYTVNLAPQTHV